MKRLDASRLARPRLCVQSLAPEFGSNYKPGYIGFTYTGSALLSRGVARFSRWSRHSDIHVSHVLVVTGENECVEIAGGRAVGKAPLQKYFDDPRTQIFFRKPRKCTPSLGQRIADTALAQVGTRYDNLLTAARILEGSFLRRWMACHFRESPDHFSCHLAKRDSGWASAELAAYCLDCQPEYADKGVLGKPFSSISPQELFEDAELFASWDSEPVEGPKAPSPRAP